MTTAKDLFVRIASYVPDALSLPFFEKWIFRAINHRAHRLPPEQALRMLLCLDALLYSLQGTTAVAYGGGTHPKHRLMKYHDFFVQRIQPEQRVLDIGCGIGALAYDIAEKAGAQVFGIDLSESNIAQAFSQYAHPRVEYRVGDALKDLPKSTFDIVVLSNVLEHLPERASFLWQVLDTIRPKRILIRVPLFEREWRVPLKKELGVEWRLDPTHETEYTVESFTAEMTEAGLSINHLEVRWGEIWAETAVNVP